MHVFIYVQAHLTCLPVVFNLLVDTFILSDKMSDFDRIKLFI